jgi:antitoxin YefM
MSLDDYNSLMTTSHELASKLNEKRLDAAIEKLNNGAFFEQKLID